MSEPTGQLPQDAEPGQHWAPPEGATASPGGGWRQGPVRQEPSGPALPPEPLPAPRGPNWMLAALGLVLVLAAGGQLGYLLGYRAEAVGRAGPQALLALGALLLLVGVVGSLRRHTRAPSRRRQRATRSR